MVSQIRPSELAALLAANKPVFLVDVREPWEHELCRLPGDVLVPLGEIGTRADEIEPPEGALVVTYCHHGVRSLRAAAVLVAHGFPQVASLAGGIDGWSTEVDPQIPRY